MVSGSPRLAVCGFVVLFYFIFFFLGCFKSCIAFLYTLYSAQCPSCLHISKGKILSVAMFVYSETELLHNTAETVGRKMGLMGQKRGSFFFVCFYLM